MQELSKFDKQLVTLNALQNESIINHVDDLVAHGYTLPEIKRQFELVYHIDISFIDSLSDLTSPESLERKQQEVEAKIKAIELEYSQALKEAEKLHREEMSEQDEKTREILQFISNT